MKIRIKKTGENSWTVTKAGGAQIRASVAESSPSQAGHYVNRDGEEYIVYPVESVADEELYHLRKTHTGAGYTGVTRAELVSQQYNGWLTFVMPLFDFEKERVRQGRDVVTGDFGELVQRTENAGQFVPAAAPELPHVEQRRLYGAARTYLVESDTKTGDVKRMVLQPEAESAIDRYCRHNALRPQYV